MTAYRLHYFPESGNSYKLALMLTLCGQTFEPVWTDFGGGVTRTAEWRKAVNEMGEIPVLEEDGERLTQTAPILLRLSKRHDKFGGRSSSERFEILRRLFWDNHKLTGYMATYRYHRALSHPPRIKRCCAIFVDGLTIFWEFWSSMYAIALLWSATGRRSRTFR